MAAKGFAALNRSKAGRERASRGGKTSRAKLTAKARQDVARYGALCALANQGRVIPKDKWDLLPGALQTRFVERFGTPRLEAKP